MLSTWGKTMSAEFISSLVNSVVASTLGGPRSSDDFDIDQVFAIGEDPEVALSTAMQRQMTAGAVGDRRGKALGLIKASDALATMGKHGESRDQASEAATICRELLFDEGTAAAIAVLARTTGPGDSDELQDALGVATDSLKSSQKMGFKKGEAVAFANSASLYLQMGEADKSIAAAKQAMVLFSELGEQVCVAEMFLALAKVYLIKKDAAKAAKRIRKAIEMVNKAGERGTEAKCWHIAAMVELIGNDVKEGEHALDEACKIYLDIGNMAGYGAVMDTKIDLLRSQNQFAQAVAAAKAKVKAHNTGNDMQGEAAAMYGLGQLLLDMSENSKAAKVAEVAMGMFAGMNDMEGMKKTKALMDGAKHAQVCDEIATSVESCKDYMHVPEGLIIDPGMNKRVLSSFTEMVNKL